LRQGSTEASAPAHNCERAARDHCGGGAGAVPVPDVLPLDGEKAGRLPDAPPLVVLLEGAKMDGRCAVEPDPGILVPDPRLVLPEPCELVRP